jgi:uncharacterized SAM-dependent methyltransferase
MARLAPAFPAIDLVGHVTDFSQRLDLAGAIDDGPVTFFYPGSSIGNFRPDEALDLLERVRQLCGPGSGLLIGADTRKDVVRLKRTRMNSGLMGRSTANPEPRERRRRLRFRSIRVCTCGVL